MEWITSLRQTVNYMENHLLEDINVQEIAGAVNISPFYLQKSFKIMTGYSLMEYMRGRRLYLAALDVLDGKEKIIDIAYKYSYDTPESFTKAFGRFHGTSPSQLKKDITNIRTFLPLKINVSIQGGNEMDYTVEKRDNFEVIGFEKEFSFESSFVEVPKYWSAFTERYGSVLFGKKEPEGELERAVRDHAIGEYGVCIDDLGNEGAGRFCYMIAGTYHGGVVPEGMRLYSFPDMEWARFCCSGRMPAALQTVETRIYKEWLPGNPDFERALGTDVEWYEKGDVDARDYRSEIWIPVKRR